MLALAAVVACSPALNWRDVRTDDGAAQWLMPCRPDRQVRELGLAGTRARMFLASCRTEEQTWAFAWADLGEPGLAANAVEALVAASRSNIDARPESVHLLASTVPGATPGTATRRLAFSGHLPDGRAVEEQTLLFTRGSRVYQATAVGARLEAQALETFFGSVRAGS
ncbi:MAG: hypothetical protein KGM91_23100 [Burkholderiales bacterium]|nr:hypothetical protein [Burkholderiales bacterium]